VATIDRLSGRFESGPEFKWLPRIGSMARKRGTGVVLRVIEYCLRGVEGSEPIYGLVTTMLEHAKAPAPRSRRLLYHDRREIEITFDERKTHLRGSRIILQSRTPDLVRQEFFGLLPALSPSGD
jgi:hypothetical protein